MSHLLSDLEDLPELLERPALQDPPVLVLTAQPARLDLPAILVERQERPVQELPVRLALMVRLEQTAPLGQPESAQLAPQELLELQGLREYRGRRGPRALKVVKEIQDQPVRQEFKEKRAQLVRQGPKGKALISLGLGIAELLTTQAMSSQILVLFTLL